MGFECGFEIIPKYKDTKIEQLDIIKAYIYYCHTSFYKDKMSFDEYYRKEWHIREVTGDIDIPDQETLDFYLNAADEYGSFNVVDFWCSSGRYFDDFLCSHLTQINENDDSCYSGFDNEFFRQAFNWTTSQQDDELEPVEIVNAIKENEDGTTTLIPCDGVEVITENEEYKKIHNDCFQRVLFVPKHLNTFDEERKQTIQSLHESLLKILREARSTDFITYYRSY